MKFFVWFREKHSHLGFLVFIVGVLALSPTVSNIFEYDDVELVKENPWIKTLSGIPLFFSGDFFRNVWGDKIYRPFLMLSLSANHFLFGEQAWGYHLINLLLHGLVSWLLYSLLRRFWGDTFRALFPALLFAIHPVHVDAVAFILNRSDLLAGIFLMTGWLVSSAWISGLLFLSAFLSKESAAFAVVLVPLFFFFAHRLAWKEKPALFQKTISMLAAFSIYALLRWTSLGGFGSSASESFMPDRSLGILIPTVARILKDYLRLLVFPSHLRIDYSDYSIRGMMLEPEALLSYAIHFFLLVYAWSCRKRWPAMMLPIVGFYVALLPVSHLIPFRDIFAERFLYLPSAFFVVGLALVLHRALQGNVRTFAASAILLLLGFVAFSYSTLFRSRINLWTAMASEQPTNSKFQYNAGVVLYEHRDCEGATLHLMEAIRLRPTYARAYRPMAKCMLIRNKKSEALALFKRAEELAPDDVITHEDLALFYYLSGNLLEAKSEINRAVALAPNRPRSKEISEMIRKQESKP